MDDQLSALEASIGYRFRDLDLLRRALTHSSVASEPTRSLGPDGQELISVRPDNEKLEFLGDSVLGFLVSEELFRRHPDQPEGQLTVIKSRVVNSAFLYRAARALNLGGYLILGRGEDRAGGREKKTVLADAVEALIAAVFLDGGIDAARSFVLHRILSADALEPGEDPSASNPKSALQQAAMALKLPLPRYQVLQETGPDHEKLFTVEVRVGKTVAATGEGSSKKTASVRAAAAAMNKLGREIQPAQ